MMILQKYLLLNEKLKVKLKVCNNDYALMRYRLKLFVIGERSSTHSTDSTFQEDSNTQTDPLIYNLEYGIMIFILFIK